MNKYKGTQTEKNLEAAFSGESGARNKYTYFASVAKKRATSKFPLYLQKLQITKKNMQKCGLKS